MPPSNRGSQRPPKRSRFNPLGLQANPPQSKQRPLPRNRFVQEQPTKPIRGLLANPKTTSTAANPLPVGNKKVKNKGPILGPRRWYWPFHRRIRITWKGIGLVFLGMLAVISVGIAALFFTFSKDLPNPRELAVREQEQSTKIVDRNGTLIYSFYGDKNRTLLKPEEVGDNLKNAVLATEDANFFNHPGFDVRGLGRAVFCRLYPNCGRVAGGGSTITQQYVKNTLVGDDQSIRRKLQELILALEIEQVYSKEEILTGYMNEIPMGGSIYGMNEAARTYFGKSTKELTIREAAVLASMIQQPTVFSPYGSNTARLFNRTDYVIGRMQSLGMITEEQEKEALAAGPSTENPTFAKRNDLTAPHFVFYVRQKLIEFIGGDPQIAERTLDKAGYTVMTSLDLPTQQLGEGIMKELGTKAVAQWDASNAALTAVDPKSGEILAMVGSIDYADSKSGNTNFSNALLQPGSSIKPVVYATAFDKENKKSPASITYDLETDFGQYKPKNYDGKFRGPVTNRSALAQSLNIPAVKNLGVTGISNSVKTAERLGITTYTGDPNVYGLSLALGSGEVRQTELVNAYAAFGNEGKHFALRPILSITKGNQMVRDFRTDQPTQAVEPEIAYQISSILSDNAARAPIFGTRSALTLADRPVAAKSGSTNDNRDAWVVGYTPQIAVGVWVGNNEANKTMRRGADGSVVAGPMWQRFMREWLTGRAVENFVRPATIKDFTVDRLSGKIPTDQSPENERITDIFAPWQIPTATDDVHVKVRVDKVTGKLVSDLTPAENIEDRIYIKVQSEQPNNPAWEGPVQAWAAANGWSGTPPTEKDDVYTEGNRPTLSIVSPTPNMAVGSTLTIEANPGGTRPITKVEFFVDNVSVGTRTEAPWKIDYGATALSSGSHVVEVRATNNLGLTRNESVTVIKGTATIGPIGPATSISAQLFGVRSVRLFWTNPSDADVSVANIYQSSGAGVLGPLVRSIPVSSGIRSSVDLLNLSSGTYWLTIRPAATGGTRENQSTQQVQIVVP
jgi:membrane peptidoglycan carboxypeptidase